MESEVLCHLELLADHEKLLRPLPNSSATLSADAKDTVTLETVETADDKTLEAALKQNLISKISAPSTSPVKKKPQKNRDSEFVAQFKRKFRHSNPHRREFQLMPSLDTDQGPATLLPRFISPTNGGQFGLVGYRQVCAFVAESCSMSLLDPPFDYPSIAQLPNTTLTRARGSSLDISATLASFLIGAGYDAYVVCGYACQNVAEFSFLDIDYDFGPDVAPFIEKDSLKKAVKELKPNKYRKRQPEAVSSPVQESVQPTLSRIVDDDMHGLRVHYWVLMLPNSATHGVDACYIEATSGNVVKTDCKDYHGVEFIFNHEDIWINMQLVEDELDSLGFNLVDSSQWESVVGPKESLSPQLQEPIDVKLLNKSRRKQVRYQNALVENFIGQPDGIVKRVSLSTPQHGFQILEWFENRHDLLLKRARGQSSTVEIFDSGKPFRRLGIVNGCIASVSYFVDARVDTLDHLIATPTRLKLFYAERDDCLVSRTAHYNAGDAEKVLRIREKYDKALLAGINERCLKVYFTFPSDEMSLHTEPKNPALLLPIKHVFHKMSGGGKKSFLERYHCVTYDPHPPSQNEYQLLAMYDYLLIQEKTSLNTVKTVQREIAEFTRIRIRDEQEIVKQLSLLGSNHAPSQDMSSTLANDNKSNGQLKQAQEADYLSAYVIDIDMANLTFDSANRIRENCLKGLRERLLLKAQIMQSRAETESAECARLQQELQNRSDMLSQQEREDKRKQIEYLNFKVKVLEKRLVKHKEIAPEKYLQLDRRLKADPRLAAHLKQLPPS